MSLPYAVGSFQGAVSGQFTSIYRSGMLDSNLRFSVNLMGGPAMQPKDMAKWKEKRTLGLSLKVVAPSGQYSGAKLINWGGNRWAFKPDIGYSERWGHWVLDGYAGVWFYTTNSAFYAGAITKPQSEAPIGALEGHFELRREATLVAVAGRKLLVGRHYDLERHTEPGEQTDRFASWRDIFIPDHQTPIDKGRL